MISGILLAAGLSTRMGRDKLLMDYRGKAMLQIAVDLLCCLPVSEKILVTTRERLRYITLPPEIIVAINPQPETGQSGSLRHGILKAAGGCYLFMSADQPMLNPEDVLPLLTAAKENKDKIIYPVIKGGPGMPVLFPAGFRSELLALDGDSGGRTIRDARPECCFPVEVGQEDHFVDIDDYAGYREYV